MHASWRRRLPDTSNLEASTMSDPLRSRQREQEWCRTHLELLHSYTGQWVVLEGEEIVAHGSDVTRLVKQARNRGIQSPYVFFVEPYDPGVAKLGL